MNMKPQSWKNASQKPESTIERRAESFGVTWRLSEPESSIDNNELLLKVNRRLLMGAWRSSDPLIQAEAERSS